MPATRKTVAVPPPDARGTRDEAPRRFDIGEHGQAVHLLQQRFLEPAACRQDVGHRLRGHVRSGREVGNRDGGGDHVGRVVAAIDGDEPREAAQEHPGPRQQHEGQGYLGHGERGARPIRTEQSEAPGRLLAPFVAGTRQIESRPTEGRRGAEAARLLRTTVRR